MNEGNSTRHWKKLAPMILIGALLILSPGSAAGPPELEHPGGVHGPPAGAVLLCENSQGLPSLFLVTMYTHEPFHHWFLQEIAPVGKVSHDVRMGFDFQQATSASLVIESDSSHSVYRQRESGVSGTPNCGWGPYDPSGTLVSDATVHAKISVPGESATHTASGPALGLLSGEIHVL